MTQDQRFRNEPHFSPDRWAAQTIADANLASQQTGRMLLALSRHAERLARPNA